MDASSKALSVIGVSTPSESSAEVSNRCCSTSGTTPSPTSRYAYLHHSTHSSSCSDTLRTKFVIRTRLRKRSLVGAPTRQSRRGGGYSEPLVPSVEVRIVARVPRVAQPRSAEVPIGADLARGGAQIAAKIVDRGPSPEPVAVVDAVNDKARLEHQSVRDHRVVVGVGVLLDIEVLLDDASRVGQKGPLGADGRAE